DLNSLTLNYWQSPAGQTALDWLEGNAGEYGYVMAYPPGRDAGPGYEPWHWSYRPLSQPLLRDFQRYVTENAIKGFVGAEQVRRLDWLKFVFGVNESLK
ncbi:MAG: D-alanyl-D-alanine carboxypeptidase family protein, partial [Candidatus Marinimicrobia bacterium]|nr:D-alanyl-D-alanine carboxypeptidase family protein [Candidatus Neomarinimicrobiota bacterium]